MMPKLCSQCFEGINVKGSPLVLLLEDIIEAFFLLREPLAITRDHPVDSLLEYLERNGYIVTTEFPDPFEDIDAILVIPKGDFYLDKGLCIFCFDADEHD